MAQDNPLQLVSSDRQAAPAPAPAESFDVFYEEFSALVMPGRGATKAVEALRDAFGEHLQIYSEALEEWPGSIREVLVASLLRSDLPPEDLVEAREMFEAHSQDQFLAGRFDAAYFDSVVQTALMMIHCGMRARPLADLYRDYEERALEDIAKFETVLGESLRPAGLLLSRALTNELCLMQRVFIAYAGAVAARKAGNMQVVNRDNRLAS